MSHRETLPAKIRKPGTFLKPPPNARRPKGVPNKTTRILKEAILLAAEQVGMDKKGHDGLVGYLKRIAISHPEEFCMLLAKVLPMQINSHLEVNLHEVIPRAKAIEDLRGRGIPVTGVFDGPAEILPPEPAHRMNGNGSSNGHAH